MGDDDKKEPKEPEPQAEPKTDMTNPMEYETRSRDPKDIRTK